MNGVLLDACQCAGVVVAVAFAPVVVAGGFLAAAFMMLPLVLVGGGSSSQVLIRVALSSPM